MPQPHPSYDAYAAVYDAMGQGEFGAQMAARTLAWVAAGQRAPLHVLDLACGTGAAALAFAAAGHHVVGVDASAAMLQRAAANAGARSLAAQWLQADLRALPVGEPPALAAAQRGSSPISQGAPTASSLGLQPSASSLQPSSFDLATCFFDSLNYLTSDNDLAAAFGAVARVLRPGASFVFDLNTEVEFATWDERDEVAHDGPDLLVYNRLRYNPDTRLASGRVVWFARQGSLWQRGEELHVERAWSRHEVRAALETAGLRLLACLTPAGEGANDATPRAVYYAQRDET